MPVVQTQDLAPSLPNPSTWTGASPVRAPQRPGSKEMPRERDPYSVQMVTSRSKGTKRKGRAADEQNMKPRKGWPNACFQGGPRASQRKRASLSTSQPLGSGQVSIQKCQVLTETAWVWKSRVGNLPRTACLVAFQRSHCWSRPNQEAQRRAQSKTRGRNAIRTFSRQLAKNMGYMRISGKAL